MNIGDGKFIFLWNIHQKIKEISDFVDGIVEAMRNIMIKIEYDGTNYNGWQIQPNGITIQGEIIKAIKNLTGEDVNLHGSGRTDARVHAKEQVANFHSTSNISIQELARGLNHFLPKDIVVKEAEIVPLEFHARHWAIGKAYSYQIYNHPQRSALLRNYSYHVSYELDINRMQRAANIFIGTHDFRGFMSSGSSVKDTVRSIHEVNLHKEGDSIWITFKGNGFLYNMVRIMVGTLVEVGSGKRDIKIIEEALKSGLRSKAGPTAPPQGLFLEKVFYPLTR